MVSWYEKHKVAPWLPEGTSGAFRVERFTVGKEDAEKEALRAALSSSNRGRGVPEGTYTRLTQTGNVWMSDTPAEQLDHLDAINNAAGNVLVTGLGLGMVAAGMLAKRPETRLTIIEREAHVVSLVKPALVERFGGARVEVIVANAYEWLPPPGVRFDYAWHDVWPTLSPDNIAKFARMRRHYQHVMTREKAQHCWGEVECKRLRANELHKWARRFV